MADFTAGEAWVELKASARGFSKDAKKALAAIDLDKSVELDADASRLQAAVKDVKAQLAALNREKVSPSIDFDKSVAEARIAEVKARLEELSAKTATPKVAVDTAVAQRELNNLERQLEGINQRRASVDVDADITQASTALRELEAKLDQVNRRRAEPTVTADVSQAQARLTELDGRLQALSGQTATPEVELRVAQAQQEALRIRADLERLGAMRASPQVNADVASASAKLARVNQQLSQLDGRYVSVNVDASSGGRASLILMGVVAALAAVGAAAPAAAAALAAVGGAAGALGQGVAAGMAAFSGIGDALKALESDEKSAATSSASASNTRTAAAKQVASAQSALAQAQTQADRAAITGAQQVTSAQQALGQARTQQARAAVQGAQQVADAQRSLAQAVQSAARTQITSAQQVADAEQAAARARVAADQQIAAARRAVSDAVAAATARVASAERSLENANRSRQYAQEALTRATQDAVRANRDLQLSVAGGALATERAALSLQQARQRLAEATTSDPLALADLSLSVREAEQNLRETQVRYGDLTDEQQKWARTGVQGSDQVVSATRALQDAQRGVADSQRGLTDAQVSGARQVADAQQALATTQQQAAQSVADAQQGVSRAVQQAAWANIDAQRGVADAQRAVGEAAASAAEANADAAEQVAQAQQGVAQAVQQAAWQQEDAAAAVADAQRRLADAYAAGGAAAAGGAQQAAYALGKLTPAGRSMVDFLRNEWQPTWKRTTDAVAEAMLPKVERAMRNLLALEPVFTAGLTETGHVLGDLAVKGSQLAASAPFQANFAAIMASNNRALRDYGDAGINLFGAFTDLYTAAGPVNEEFARLAEYSTEAFESWVIGARQSGELDRYLRMAADTLQYLGGWLVDVGGDVLTVAGNLAPLGVALLELIRNVTDFVARLSSVSPTLTSVVVGAGLAAVALSKLSGAMAAGGALSNLAVGARAAGGGLTTVFNPAAMAATGALTSLRGGFDKAGDAAARNTAKITGSAGAGDAVGRAMSGAGRGVSNLAGALPGLGIAAAALWVVFDTGSTSLDEAATGFEKGGASAQKMRQAIEAQNQTPIVGENWINDLNNWMKQQLGLTTSVEDGYAALEKQRGEMTNLAAAQSRLTEAQGNYELAVRTFGQNSPQAVEAQRSLADASGRVAVEQEAARRATMNATQALQDQQNQILGSIDANLALRQSAQSVKEAQQAYRDAVNQSGAGSDAAASAQLRLEQAQTTQAAAARRAAEEEAKRKGVTDASALSNEAYARSVGDMVAASTGELTPALTQMVQSLDGAGLAAAGAKVDIDNAGNAVATFPDGKTVTLNAQTSPEFFANLQAAKAAVDSTRGTIGVDADPGLGEQKVGAFKLRVDQTTGVIGIDGNITPADQQRLGIQAKTDGTTGTMWINGNPVQADGQLNGMRVRVDQTTGVMTIDGAPQPAIDAGNEAKGNISNPHTQPTITPGVNPVHVDGFWATLWRKIEEFSAGFWGVFNGTNNGFQGAGGGPVPKAHGGYVGAYAAGGPISHKKVIGFPAGGNVRGPGTSTSDSIPALLSNGEYVIRASAVQALGVPTLDVLNRMASGGPVRLASGGAANRSPGLLGSAPAVAVPVGDPRAVDESAAATDRLAQSMHGAATSAAALTPAMAGLQSGQQRLVAGGVSPLASAITGPLQAAFGVYRHQAGAVVPAANGALQAAQTATRASTTLTAANTAQNAAAMASATTGMSLQAQAQHAGLRAGQAATQASTTQTAVNTTANTAAMAGATTAMSAVSQGQHSALRQSQGQTVLANNVLAADTRAQTGNMAAATTGMSGVSQQQHSLLRQSQGQTVLANNALATNTAVQTGNMSGSTIGMSGTVQNHLGQIRGAQGVTAGSTTAFADSWRDQMGRTMPDSGNPLRWVINFPIRSITDAWNNLDRQFALGKHVPPFVPNFATGGRVSGAGGGTADRVPAMLSSGEFIVRESVTRRAEPFLRALNGGQPEALQAAGAGKTPDRMLRMAAGGGVAEAIGRAVNVARSMSGRPYIWGGASPRGADCSGYQSIITNALRSPANPFRRIGTTATFPWPGFAPGLRGAYAIGAFKGNPGHMAGTLAGVNVEAGGSPSRVKHGAGAVGADHPQFRTHGWLPTVGGQFVSGGAGGGGGFDPTPAVDAAFAKTYREIADVTRFFGNSPQVLRDQGVAKFSADRVRGKALEQLMAAMGSMNIAGISGPVVEQVRQVAHRFGWGAGPQWDNGIFPLVAKESSWDPNAANPTSSARGLFQKMTSIHGPVEPTPAGQAAWGLNYIRGRYGDPVRAWAFHRSRGFYDNGGILEPGEGGFNGTPYPERVLNNVETRSYDTLTRLVGKDGVKVDIAPYAPQQPAPAIGTLNAVVPQGATVNDMARAVTFQVRRARRGGVYANG